MWQEYIRHLIFERLADDSIVDVLKKLMKLPWAESEPYLLKCLLKVSPQHNCRVSSTTGRGFVTEQALGQADIAGWSRGEELLCAILMLFGLAAVLYC